MGRSFPPPTDIGHRRCNWTVRNILLALSGPSNDTNLMSAFGKNRGRHANNGVSAVDPKRVRNVERKASISFTQP
jgi:hypothetical protein